MRAVFAEVLARMGRLEYDGRPAFLRSNFQRGVTDLLSAVAPIADEVYNVITDVMN